MNEQDEKQTNVHSTVISQHSIAPEHCQTYMHTSPSRSGNVEYKTTTLQMKRLFFIIELLATAFTAWVIFT
jgi:hypothetical protein